MVMRRFFYVSAGLLCLVLIYHVGATGARAQTTSAFYSIGEQGNPIVACPSGDISMFNISTRRWEHHGNALTGRPGRTVAGLTGAACYIFVLLDDGELLQSGCVAVGADESLQWSDVGSPSCGAATSNVRSSWGAVRTRYRGAR